MKSHYRTLGWIFLIVGLLVLITAGVVLPFIIRALPALFADMQADMAKQHTPDATMMRSMFGAFIAMWVIGIVLFLANFIACAINGWGLLTRKPWARMMTIVLSILAVTQAPVGTAIGIYGLWAMFKRDGELEWDQYVKSPQPAEG